MTTMAWEDLINKALQMMVYQVDRPTPDRVGSRKRTKRLGSEYVVAVAVNDIDTWMLRGLTNPFNHIDAGLRQAVVRDLYSSLDQTVCPPGLAFETVVSIDMISS